jgi:hypothetical protein
MSKVVEHAHSVFWVVTHDVESCRGERGRLDVRRDGVVILLLPA